jgi:hypothetical protein
VPRPLRVHREPVRHGAPRSGQHSLLIREATSARLQRSTQEWVSPKHPPALRGVSSPTGRQPTSASCEASKRMAASDPAHRSYPMRRQFVRRCPFVYWGGGSPSDSGRLLPPELRSKPTLRGRPYSSAISRARNSLVDSNGCSRSFWVINDLKIAERPTLDSPRTAQIAVGFRGYRKPHDNR